MTISYLMKNRKNINVKTIPVERNHISLYEIKKIIMKTFFIRIYERQCHPIKLSVVSFGRNAFASSDILYIF